MKISVSSSMSTTTMTVNVEHLGQVLSFSVGFYRQKVFTGEFDIFSQINAYWADQAPEIQQAIFNIYRQIFDAFGEVRVETSLKEHLQRCSEQLMGYHNLDVIREWIAFRATDIRVPPSVPSEFVPDINRNLSEGKTFIAKDYRKLTALSLALRAMIPVWGEYIASIKSETENSFLAIQAFQLVDRVLTPQVDAIWKLNDYIEHTLRSVDVSPSVGVFKGIPSADYARWMLALVCTRCLSVADIRGAHPETNLATYVYIFVTNRFKSSRDDGGDSKIKEKKIDETAVDDGSRSSALERYKIKSNISVGDLVEIEYFLNNHYRNAKLLAPSITEQEVSGCLTSIRDYDGAVTPPQITLLRWLFKPIVSHPSWLYMPDALIKQTLAVGEAVLWNRGHKYLAVLLSCHPIWNEKELVVSPMDSKMRIPAPLMETLDTICPYRQPQKGKKTTHQGVKEVNMATVSIDNVTNDFMMYGWRPTASPERVEEVLGYRSMRFLIKSDIKSDLARLVIEVAQQSYLPAP